MFIIIIIIIVVYCYYFYMLFIILSIINIYYYLPTCGIQITYGHFREFTNVKEAFTASSGIGAKLPFWLLGFP